LFIYLISIEEVLYNVSKQTPSNASSNLQSPARRFSLSISALVACGLCIGTRRYEEVYGEAIILYDNIA
jgi:hypothetical protein